MNVTIQYNIQNKYCYSPNHKTLNCKNMIRFTKIIWPIHIPFCETTILHIKLLLHVSEYNKCYYETCACTRIKCTLWSTPKFKRCCSRDMTLAGHNNCNNGIKGNSGFKGIFAIIWSEVFIATLWPNKDLCVHCCNNVLKKRLRYTLL
jgi:hypothetical protein